MPIPGVSGIGDLVEQLDPNRPKGVEIAKALAEMKKFRLLLKMHQGQASVWTEVRCEECECTNWFTGWPFYRPKTGFAWKRSGKKHWVRCDLSQTAWGKGEKERPASLPYIDKDTLFWGEVELDDIDAIKRQCAEQAEKSCGS